jgi:hypothetical protein
MWEANPPSVPQDVNHILTSTLDDIAADLNLTTEHFHMYEQLNAAAAEAEAKLEADPPEEWDDEDDGPRDLAPPAGDGLGPDDDVDDDLFDGLHPPPAEDAAEDAAVPQVRNEQAQHAADAIAQRIHFGQPHIDCDRQKSSIEPLFEEGGVLDQIMNGNGARLRKILLSGGMRRRTLYNWISKRKEGKSWRPWDFAKSRAEHNLILSDEEAQEICVKLAQRMSRGVIIN